MQKDLPGVPSSQSADWLSGTFEGLTSPELFCDLNAADGLTALVDQRLPPDARHSRTFPSVPRGSLDDLASRHEWRAMAAYAMHRITRIVDPGDTDAILRLYILRFQALQRLRLFDELAKEVTRLTDLLPRPYDAPYPRPHLQTYPVFRLPFDLVLFSARSLLWQGNHAEALEKLWEVFEGARREARNTQIDLERKLWSKRACSTALVLLYAILEQKDYSTALHLADQLRRLGVDFDLAPIQLFRLQMQTGNIKSARAFLDSLSEKDERTEALQALSFAAHDPTLRSTLDDTTDPLWNPNCESIAALLEGHPMTALLALQDLPKTRPAEFFNSVPLVRNFATVLELVQCPSASLKERDTKLTLLSGGARHSEDGFPPASYKLPLVA